MCPDLGFQRGLHRVPGGIGGVDYAAVAVATLAGEVIAHVAGLVAGERNALPDKPVDGLASALDHVAGDFGVAQSRAGDHGVADVVLGRVVLGEHRGNAALGPVGGAVQEFALGDDADFLAVGQIERDGEAGQAAADDRDIETRHGSLAGSERGSVTQPPSRDRCRANTPIRR